MNESKVTPKGNNNVFMSVRTLMHVYVLTCTVFICLE